MNIIEIWWEGPYSIADLQNSKEDETMDYGIYQIYGTHNISGPGSLLYIGKASDQTFKKRLSQHAYWTEWESSAMEYYIGRLGGINNVEEEKWTKLIGFAERLLIYYCAPPYNTQFLNGFGHIDEDTIVLNLNKKNRLPLEVSSLYENSKAWDPELDWKPYSTS